MMPETALNIGGREYRVACNPGEEEQLQQAAALLDTEAQSLLKALGRVPETRMLLMSGLMLADRTTEIAIQAQALQKEAQSLKSRLREAEDRVATLSSQASAAGNGADTAEIEEARRTAEAAIATLEAATLRVERMAAERRA